MRSPAAMTSFSSPPFRPPAPALELLDEICGDVSPQPFALAAAREINTDDARAVAALDEFAHQLCRRLAPQRLDVPESGGGGAFLVPGAHVGEVDVAEGDGADAEAARLVESLLKRLLEVVGVRLELKQRLSECIRLRAD